MSKKSAMTLLLRCAMVCGVVRLASAANAMDFPGPAPGKPVAEVRDDQMQIGNAAIAARWSLAGGSLRPVQVQNRLTGQAIDLRGCESFRLSLAGGKQLAASDLKVVGRPSVQSMVASPQTPILARHFAGKQLVARLAAADGSLEIQWRTVLREEDNAFRQQITLRHEPADPRPSDTTDRVAAARRRGRRQRGWIAFGRRRVVLRA